jgi:putative inorganic carbon (hco3(-)) transporter
VSAALTTPRPARAVASARAIRGGLLWAALVVSIGAAVALPEPFVVLLGAAGLGALVVSLIQPLVSLPLLLLAVPFGGLARGGSGDTTSDLSFGAAEILVAVLGAAWCLRGVRTRNLQLRAGVVVVAALAVVTLAALSIGYAQDKSSAIKETLKWLELLVALLIVCDLAREPTTARWVIGAMLVASAAEATYGVAQFFTDSGPGAFALQGALRAFGHFEQPNPFAGYLATVLPLAVCVALSPANTRAFRVLAVAASVLLVVGIGLSQSRGAWLGAGVAGICLLLAWSRATRRLLIPGALGGTLIVALALAGLLPGSVLDRLGQTIEYFGVFDVRTVEATSENWAVVERMAHWQAGWYMFLDHPWLGVGAGNYAEAYAEYFVGSWREALGHAHNYYLNILAELGLVGGALLVVLLGVAFRQLGVALRRSEDRADTFWRAVLAGVVGGLVVFCVHNLFDSLFVHSVNIQIGVLLGLGLVAADRV